MHNGLKPYNFARIEYQEEVYGITTPYGIKLGSSASPAKNKGHHSWDVMAHEQGHNFFGGTSSFYIKLATPYPFLQESLSVLSASYAYNYLINNISSLGISNNAKEDLDFVFNEEEIYQKDKYNNYTSQGKKFNISDVLTSQALDYKMIQYGEIYGWENYRKVAKAFEDSMSSKFTFQNDGVSAEEQSTYIIAVLGAAFDRDFRQDFIELNFPINQSLYDQVYSILKIEFN